MASPLSPQSIIQCMVEALPTHTPGDTTSDLSSSYEAIGLFCHACMASLGFRLVGLNENKQIESECDTLRPRLPITWNASFGAHSFVYAHSQSSMRFVLKVDRLGGKADIRALAVGDERINRLEVTARDFVSSNALPVRIPLVPAGDGGDGEEKEATEDRTPEGGLHASLRHVFISEARIKDLADLLKLNIIMRIVPNLNKEGYEESAPTGNDDNAAGRGGGTRQPQRGPRPEEGEPPRAGGGHHLPPSYPALGPDHDYNPTRRRTPPPPRRSPAADFPPPDFEDPHDLGRTRPPPWRHQEEVPHADDRRSPYNIGYDDLNPPDLGLYNPVRPAFVPGIGGGGIGRLPIPGSGGGSGMHPALNDPLFHDGPAHGEYDPRNPPPGARWDPLGPESFGLGPPGSRRRPGGGNGFGGGSFGGFGGGRFI